MNDTLRERLRAGDPAHATTPYSEERIAHLASTIPSTADTNVVTLKPRRRTLQFAVAASVAAALAIGPIMQFGHTPPAAQAAADVLNAAANNVQTGEPAKPGQFWKVTTHSSQDGSSSVENRITYTPVSGIGYYYFKSEAWGPDGKPIDQVHTYYRGELPVGADGAWQVPSPEFLASLPIEINQLRARLYADSEGHGNTVDGEAFVYLSDLLRSPLVSPELQARLLRVAATIPGVEVTSEVVNLDGRKGVGLSCVENRGGERIMEVVVDVSTGEVIGERTLWKGKVQYTVSSSRELADAVPADFIEQTKP